MTEGCVGTRANRERGGSFSFQCLGSTICGNVEVFSTLKAVVCSVMVEVCKICGLVDTDKTSVKVYTNLKQYTIVNMITVEKIYATSSVHLILTMKKTFFPRN